MGSVWDSVRTQDSKGEDQASALALDMLFCSK